MYKALLLFEITLQKRKHFEEIIISLGNDDDGIVM
jgi:hypothetical protein